MNTKITLPKPRNWVVKNDHNRAQRHRDATQYQRQPKHKNRQQVHTNLHLVDH